MHEHSSHFQLRRDIQGIKKPADASEVIISIELIFFFQILTLQLLVVLL